MPINECFAKRRLLPFYQRVKREDNERWSAWNVTPELEQCLMQVLRMKPRRTASGVATITVSCCFGRARAIASFVPTICACPRAYLHAEPACARAEQTV